MKKQLVIIGTVAILITGGLAGCNRMNNSYTNEKNKFIGTWIYQVPSGTGLNYTFIYNFFSNGTFSFNKNSLMTNGTFDIIDGNLWLTTNTSGNNEYSEYSYVFSENNTQLTVNGTPYTKQ